MTHLHYPAPVTGLLLVDPYNDFMSEGGKLHAGIKAVADKVGFFDNLRQILAAVRAKGVRVFIVPHHRFAEGAFDGWDFMTPMQKTAVANRAFEAGAWGGEFHPEFGPQPGDVVIKEHLSASGFAGTDLDAQLKQHGVEKLILTGLTANTCLEGTARYGMELGYHVTLVRDATAAFTLDEMHAAHDVNGPMFAHAIVDTQELLATLSADRD